MKCLHRNEIQDDDQYLDLKRLSRYSSLSVRTLREYITDGVDPLPSFVMKKKILVKRSEFDAWMNSRRNDVHRLDSIVDEVLKGVSG